jgi:peroxiredoxin
MLAYQAGIAKFRDAGYEVIGASTDNTPSLKYWADNVIKPDFKMASDFSSRKAAKDYGVLAASGVANRTTFVIDPEGNIVHIEEGSAAIDPTGALTACSRTKKK